MSDEKTAILEALIFASDTPLTPERLADVLPDTEKKEILSLLEELSREYETRGGGILLVQVAGGFQFRTKPDMAPWIRKMKAARPAMLSPAALETMAGLEAEWLFPGHGLVVHGREAVRLVLTETARYLRVIIDQVLERMNAGDTPEEVFHAVEPDAELARRPFLRANYDHPKFIVRNLLRLWGGWWSGNAADLLPATWEAQAKEIAQLAGGVAAVVARGRSLLAQGDAVLASHLAEWATRAAPDDAAAQRLKRDVYERRLAEAHALMAQGIFRAAMNDAKKKLGD